MSTVALIIIVIILVSLIGIPGYRRVSKSSKTSPKEEAEANHIAHLRERGVDPLTRVEIGKYIGGHADIGDIRANGRFYRSATDLLLYNKRHTFKEKNTPAETSIDFLAKIPLSAIKEITVEKQSVVQQNVSTGLFTVTPAATTSWTTDKKMQRAFLIVTWMDSGLTRNTLFEYDGPGAFALATKSRNQLLQLLKIRNAH